MTSALIRPRLLAPQQPDPRLAQLRLYWQSLRQADALPARCDVDPSAIDGILPYSFVLQRVAGQTARIRTGGAEIRSHLGMDPRGLTFETLFAPSDRDRIGKWIVAALETPAAVTLPLEAITDGQTAIPAQMILLPMQDRRGDLSRLLGAVVTKDAPAGPRRFAFRDDIAAVYERLPKQMKRPDRSPRPALRLVVDNG